MSENAIRYVMNRHYLSQGDALKIYYPFNSGVNDYEIIGTTGVINNMPPAFNTGTNRGLITHGGADTAIFKTTGNFLVNSGQGDLSYSNIEISGDLGSNLNDLSILCSFQEKQNSNAILFGCMQEAVATIGGKEVIGASGYNIGINDNNKLFFQHRNQEGGYILTAEELPLAEKNVVGFSITDGNIEFSRFDYTTNKIHSQDFTLDTSSVVNAEKFFLGGSPYFYKTSSANTTTFSGLMDEFLLFSGSLPNYVLFELGSGLVGDYTVTGASTADFSSNITGYTRTLLYPTGVTGYALTLGTQVDAPLSGVQKVYGSDIGLTEIQEGVSFNTGLQLSSILGDTYTENKGFLVEQATFSYLPTGTEAFTTLGLQLVSGFIDVHTGNVTYINANTTGVLTAFTVGLTGFLDEATGYLETPLYETNSGIAEGASGISINPANLDEYRFDYLHFLPDATGYFDFVVNTGFQGVPDNTQLYGDYFDKTFLVNTHSGNVINASLNGQTLLETVALEETFLNQVVFTNSGSQYIESGAAKSIKDNLFEYDDTYYYRQRPQSGSPFFSADTNTLLTSGFSGAIGLMDTPHDIYLNGTKLASGVSYEASGGYFSWKDSDTDVTGVLFAVPKPQNFQEFSGISESLHGTRFIKDMSCIYLNGAEINNNDFIELNTGLDKLIQTGFASRLCPDLNASFSLSV